MGRHYKKKILTESHKRKIAEALRGRKRPPEIAEKARAALTGRKHSAEARMRMSKAKQGENNPMFGRTHTFTARIKMSEAQTGNKKFLGKHHTLEARQKISENNGKKRLSVLGANPELLEKYGMYFLRGFGPVTKPLHDDLPEAQDTRWVFSWHGGSA